MEQFRKFFFPDKMMQSESNLYNFSDSDGEDANNAKNPSSANKKISKAHKLLSTNGIINMVLPDSPEKNALSISSLSTYKNKDISAKIKEIEMALVERLSKNWVSVRKAFLDNDLDYDGFLTAEDFARIVGGSSGSSKFDFNLLKMLINIRIKKNDNKINYTEFCRWFGSIIKPVEAFQFRHDSMKNPQYEKNLKKME